MTVRAPAQGLRILLEAAVGKVAQAPLEARLFTNFVLDTGRLTEADFEEPVGAGYAPRPLEASAWREVPEAWPPALQHPEVAFQFEEALGFVRGFFVVQRGSGRLVVYETFVQPVNVRRRGDRIVVTPRLASSVG